MPDEIIELKKVTAADVDELLQLSIQTYSDTFAHFNTEDNMRKYLKEAFNKEKLLVELEDNNSGFYFAKSGNKIAGYIKFNFGDAQTDIKDNKAMEIERLYATKEFHGKGIGKLLLNKAVHVSEDAGMDYIWLGVWEKNFRAQRFYEKHGFFKFSEHIFMLGEDKQLDYLVKKEL